MGVEYGIICGGGDHEMKLKTAQQERQFEYLMMEVMSHCHCQWFQQMKEV
jgi:hypothetical protein